VLVSAPAAVVRAAEADILPTLKPLVMEVTKRFSQNPPERQQELKKIAEHLPAGTGPGDYICSLEVTPGKSARSKCCG